MRTTGFFVIDSIFSKVATGLATLAMTTLPVAAQAQQAQEQMDQAQEAETSAASPFGIPSDVVMFEKHDPNIRTATAKVNGAIITGTDIDQRVALVLAASQNQDLSAEELQALRMQVLRNLIDETLQIQAAAAQDMTVNADEVNERYLGLAQQNFPERPAAMDEYLTKIGSSPAALKRQIEGEVAWSMLIQRNVSPFVNVSADEVNEIIKQLEESRGQFEYRLAEIYLSATPETAAATKRNAQQIMEQISKGANFQAFAKQYSESSTAAVGGDLGFVRLATLPNEMADVAKGLEVGQVVGPVQIPGGFVIMLLLDKRQILMADPRDASLSLKQISISFEPDVSQEEANAKVQKFAEAVSSIRGCGDAARAAGTVGASVVDNNSIRIRDLPEQLQSAMLQLQVGQATPPFGSLQDGVRVLLLCGRDDPEVAEKPDFKQIMDQIENERIGKRAQRYLRDLRNDAIIEYN
ncbi:peptidylprolyl isomerase [Citromicrobium bathyomarinum]|uniref:peptidylprolyl isomerase n=1 Tax=Citromicrobium bathyomarinum TaxID=72174 RepID=UPI00315AD217